MASTPSQLTRSHATVHETEIGNATTADGHQVVRVCFRGEGGEGVVVHMANVQDVAVDQASAERVKAVLVQTATLDMATNDYDAQSNGNFDQVSVTGATDQDGAIYIFEYRDGDGARRVPPSRLPSLEAARQEALRCAVDLLADPDLGVKALPAWLIRVYDENGNLVCAVDAHEADAARQRASDRLENPTDG